jgi:ATP synthase subunit 6
MEQFTIIPIYVIPITLGILYLQTRLRPEVVPTNYQIANESLFRTINLLISANLKSGTFLPLIYALFFMILVPNYIGLIPYSTTGSTEIIITLTLAITSLVGIFIYGFLQQGVALTYLFLPAGTPLGLLPLMIPLEILAYLTRTLSLGLRLAVNLITGHILIKVLLSFLPNIMHSVILVSSLIIFLVLFISLEILINYLQAYIFVFITLITLKDFS